MPCRDNWSDPHEPCRRASDRLDFVTRLLCELCTSLEKEKDGKKLFSKELSLWWSEHQRNDAARKRENEQAEKKRREGVEKMLAENKLREKALQKLTTEERRALLKGR